MLQKNKYSITQKVCIIAQSYFYCFGKIYCCFLHDGNFGARVIPFATNKSRYSCVRSMYAPFVEAQFKMHVRRPMLHLTDGVK